MPTMQKITPNLWFAGNAEEAVNFYISLFDNARIVRISRYGKSGPLPEGTIMAIAFELAGQSFTAINAGPQFKLSEAISFHVACDSQDEIDRLWEALTDGGLEQPCGWLKDRFGLSWQINTAELPDLMSGDDPARADRVMGAMLQMKKIDVARLKQAYAG